MTVKAGRPKKTEIADVYQREARIIELRRAGWAFDKIAQEVGYTNTQACRDAFKRALKRTLDDAGADEARKFENDRLERLQAAHWDRAMQGDVHSSKIVLQIMDQRARLLGLNMPTKVEAKVEHTEISQVDAEIARLVEMLNKNAEVG